MTSIPRIFHQIWVGPRMPGRFREYARTWQEHHPGWEYRLWTESELDHLDMVNRHYYDNAEEHQPAFRVPRQRANIARLEILETFGGVYVDTDVRCLKNIEPLLEGVTAFAAYSPNGKLHLTNAIMGSTPGHPFIAATVAELAAAVDERPGKGSWKQTGPEHLTRVLAAHPDCGLTVFPSEVFYPVGMDDWKKDRNADQRLDLSGAYAVHEWASQKRSPLVMLGGRVLRRLGLR